MKVLSLALILFGMNASATDAPIFSLVCDGSRYETKVKLEAKSFINYSPEEMDLRDLTVTYTDDGGTTVGRTDLITTDANYRPTRYKNHKRFSLNQLTEVERFGRYFPGGCNLLLMFPESAGNAALKFNAPMLLGCDQSGGLMTLRCVAKKIRD